MIAKELLNTLTVFAKEYKKGSQKSLENNYHMNDIESGELVEQRHIHATLVDFINFIGVKYGVDYALYTSDLQ